MSLLLRTLFFCLLAITLLPPGSTSDARSQTPTNPGGLPVVRAYLPRDYAASGQNWAIDQDSRGVLYFGNTQGLLEFDGREWRLHRIPNNVVRSLAIHESGRVLVGGSDEIGYMMGDRSGILQYVSLVRSIPTEHRDFDDVWSLYAVDSVVYAQTFSRIFIFHIKTSGGSDSLRVTQVRTVATSSRFFPAVLANRQLYVVERNTGLHILDGEHLSFVSGGEVFKKDIVYAMLPFRSAENSQGTEKSFLVGTLRQGLFIYDGNEFRAFKTGADEFLNANRLYLRGTVMPDGTYALGTQIGGVVVIDAKGRLRKVINKVAGLPNDTVWFVFCDREGGLWLALDNGLARVMAPFSTSIFDASTGLDGRIASIQQHERQTYVTTGSGVYKHVPSRSAARPSTFRKVDGINVQSWSMLSAYGTLLVATNDGVYTVSDLKAKPVVANLTYAYTLQRSLTDPTRVYVGRHNGLATLHWSGRSWGDAVTVPNVADPVQSLAEGPPGVVWIGGESGGLTRVDLRDQKHPPLVQRIPGTSDLALTGIQYLTERNRVICGTNKGLRVFNAFTGEREKAGLLSKDLVDTTYSIRAMSLRGGELWLLRSKNDRLELVAFTDNDNGGTIRSRLPSVQTILKESPSFTQYDISIQPDVAVWVGGGESILRLEPLRESSELPPIIQTLIRKVTVADSLVFGGGNSMPATMSYTFPYEAPVVLEFSIPSFLDERENEYQYYLEGFRDSWSPWSTSGHKEYAALPPGSYRFRVHARNVTGAATDETPFSFIILPPWYLTTWAFVGYGLFGSMVFWFAMNIRVRMLTGRTRKLETVVSERTSQIVAQKTQLEEQARRLLELDQLKSRFFTNISHEFRTPLSLILGQIQSALPFVREPKTREKLETASRNASRLQRLINQLLGIARLESGKTKLNAVPTNLVTFLRNRFFSFESLADQKAIALRFDHSPQDIMVFIDRDKFVDIIDNLLSNAMKFTSKGGTVTLTLRSDPDARRATIIVADTGIGIPSDQVPLVFDRFHQVDASQTREHEGSGLGLSIVRELVALHHGEITVSSNVGEGSTFTISLPLGKEHLRDGEIGEGDAEEIPEKNASMKIGEHTVPVNSSSDSEHELSPDKPLVLIVEDNADMRQYIKEQLEEDYSIALAENGEAGLAQARTILPDLVISDVMMPRMDGVQMNKALKNDRRTSHVPVIILTARATEEGKLEGLEAGADDYLIKPFNPRELRVRVGNLIKIRKLLRERFTKVTAINPDEVSELSLDREFLDKVITVIKERLEDQQFSVQSLAGEVGMSVSQLNRKLNALINQSAGKLLRSSRLEFAAQLLLQKSDTVTDIAFRVGFSDSASFTRSFKDRFGCSPTDYVRRHTEAT